MKIFFLMGTIHLKKIQIQYIYIYILKYILFKTKKMHFISFGNCLKMESKIILNAMEKILFKFKHKKYALFVLNIN